MRQTKDLKFRYHVKADEPGTFEGMLAIYGNVDLGNDIIEKGAFAKTLASKSTVPLLWQHDPKTPIGSLQLADTPRGLSAKGSLVMADPQAQSAYALIKAGALSGLSIGYDVIQSDYDDAGVRHLKELRLWEGSIVTFPMNEAATISSVKSLDAARRMLVDAAQSGDDAQIAELKGLLEHIKGLLEPDDEEIDLDAEDAEDEDELAAKSILADLVMELKGRTTSRAPLRW